ncbi:MAG: hypothetical protein WAM97_00890, partial [Acidimicrobiales bacterium]
LKSVRLHSIKFGCLLLVTENAHPPWLLLGSGPGEGSNDVSLAMDMIVDGSQAFAEGALLDQRYVIAPSIHSAI